MTLIILTDSEEARHEGRGVDTIRERSAQAAEAEIERFIQRRAAKAETDPDELDSGYIESVRRFQARAAAEMRTRWIDYHRHLQVLHQNLADEHEAERQKLLESEATKGADE